MGCSCPEEVFENIDYAENLDSPWERRIEVGDRLLIYIVNVDRETDAVGSIDAALRIGVAERNSKRLNRFRLVLLSSEGAEYTGTAYEKVFCNSPYHDDRTHLHIVDDVDLLNFGRT